MLTVWLWRKGRIQVHALRETGYESIAKSELLPGVNLGEIVSFLDEPNQTAAVRAYRQRLRSGIGR